MRRAVAGARAGLLGLALVLPGAVHADPGATGEPEPGDTDAPEAAEDTDPRPTYTIPSPAEGARRAPEPRPGSEGGSGRSTGPRPEGVPDDWAEVPLEPEADTDDEADIVVWGTAAVQRSRAVLVNRFEELGWSVRKRKPDGSVVFAGREPWMGSARLDPGGYIQFRKRWLWADPVRPVEGTPMDGMDALDQAGPRGQAGTTTRGGLRGPVSDRKLDGPRRELLEGVQPQLTRYRRVLAETAFRQTLAVIPDRLDRLWASGEPMAPGPVLDSPAERRAAILDYWATRPDTREGRLAMRAVEDWIAEVLQDSEHPATPAELDAAAARRGDGRHPLGGS
jgi:hypothetical protein